MSDTLTVLGDYSLGYGFLGEGTQGQVVKARHIHTRQMVALKIFSLDDESGKRGFENELNAFTLLKGGDYLVRAQRSFRHERKGIIVLDLMDSNLLQDYVIQGTQSELQVVHIFQLICTAVQQMHRKNLGHMDIKPENILLDAAGIPYLCDFGASVMYQEHLRYRGTRGTPGYTCPEMREDYFYPPSADIWSLGILLHILLTGCFPYETSDDNDDKVVFTQERFSKSYLKNPNLSPSAKDLIQMMLCMDPKLRPSIDEVLFHPFFDVGEKSRRVPSRPLKQITKKLRKLIRSPTLASV